MLIIPEKPILGCNFSVIYCIIHRNISHMKRFAFLSVLLFISLTTFSQSINRAQLDSFFNALEAHHLAIGNIMITSAGKPVYQRSFGKDQTDQTEYRIGSITKVFTAVMIYQLIEAKKLTLDTKLAAYYPELPNADKITIAELLGHRSGLANFTNNTGFDNWKEQPKTHEELLALIKNQKPDFEPNAKADYNNSNYLLLGYIIEKIYQKPYSDVVTERIIKKLALNQTYYGVKPGFQPGEAISYKYFNNEWKPDKAVYLDNFGGAGAIISTPADLCKFINAIFAYKLIRQQSVDRMKTMVDGYGMGMFPYGDKQHQGFGHNGKTEGFGSSMQYYPENKLAIAYCTSGEVYPKSNILDHVFKSCFNLPDTVPDFKIRRLNAKLLETYTGTYSGSSGLEVTNTLDQGQLILSLKGQPFKLDAISEQEFWNAPFGFFFYFDQDGKQLFVEDAGTVYELHKK